MQTRRCRSSEGAAGLDMVIRPLNRSDALTASRTSDNFQMVAAPAGAAFCVPVPSRTRPPSDHCSAALKPYLSRAQRILKRNLFVRVERSAISSPAHFGSHWTSSRARDTHVSRSGPRRRFSPRRVLLAGTLRRCKPSEEGAAHARPHPTARQEVGDHS